MDVEDIWDIPAAPRSPARTPNADLFLPGSDDENDRMLDAPPLESTREAEIDVDALFGDVDNLPNETGQDDRALGLTSRPVLSSSPAHRLDGDDKSGGEKDAKKQKKKIARLDEGRLVDDNGFPRLAEDTKAFKIKGKGHEASDLSRLLQVYQFWTHRLYPKTPFKETIDRVEKLCHSKRMHNMLSVWRDQAHGKQSGADGDEDDELLDLSLPKPDSNRPEYASSSSHPPTRPPSSDGDLYDSDTNEATLEAMDAAGRRNVRQIHTEQRHGGTQPTNNVVAPSQSSHNAVQGGQEAMLTEMDEVDAESEEVIAVEAQTRPSARPNFSDDNEDEWDAFNSMDATSIPADAPPNSTNDVEDGWDAIYSMETETAVPLVK